MESSLSSILSVSQLSFFSPKPKLPYFSSPPPTTSPLYPSRTKLYCHKMFVPGFGEAASPESKAANNLHGFFTYIAVKIVLAQLQYGTFDLCDVVFLVNEYSWEYLGAELAALRILEVRSAYCKNDFEWDNMKRLSLEMVDESNTRLMRDYVLETTHLEHEK